MIQREVASIDEAEQQTGMTPFHASARGCR